MLYNLTIIVRPQEIVSILQMVNLSREVRSVGPGSQNCRKKSRSSGLERELSREEHGLLLPGS